MARDIIRSGPPSQPFAVFPVLRFVFFVCLLAVSAHATAQDSPAQVTSQPAAPGQGDQRQNDARAIAADHLRSGDALEQAQQLYNEGAFFEAATVGEASGRADGYALAARALLAEARMLPGAVPREQLIQAAVADARRALAENPDHVEGNLQYAVALGVLGRLRGPVSAWLSGYAGEARQAIDRALGVAPGEAWAHAVLGGWHLEIVAAAGDTLALDLLGARRDAGLAAFERARMLAPDNPVIAYEYARSLLRLGLPGEAQRAQELLDESRALPAADAVERWTRRQACALSMLLAQGTADLAAGLADGVALPVPEACDDAAP